MKFKNKLFNTHNINIDKMLVFFILSNYINAIVLKLYTIGTISIKGLLIELSFLLFLGFISMFIKNNKKRNIYYIIWSIILVAICIINSIYYTYYDSFASASLLATSTFITEVGDAVFELILKPKDMLFLWQPIMLIYLVNKKKSTYKSKKKDKLIVVYSSLALLLIGIIIPPYNSWSKLTKLWNRSSVVDNFGIYIYQFDDLIQSIRPEFNNLFGHDAALKKVKDFYSKEKIYTTNEYTDIFEGKNVIAIHAESLQSFTMNMSFEGESVTPNLNRLASEGLYFSNFYAQVGVGTSSDTEFTYSTSLMPSLNGTVFVNYYNNKYETIQKLLKEKDYYVFSMHGNEGNFWNRDVMHKNLGYDKFYSKSSFVIDEEYGLGLSDGSFFKQAVPMIKGINDNHELFYGTLITLTNHTPWAKVNEYSEYKVSKSITVGGQYITRPYLEDTTIGKYIKSVNYMDKCIGTFIEELDKEGILDNTIIVIYGDHDARLSKKDYEYMYNYDPYTDKVLSSDDENYHEVTNYEYELNRKVPFIIWSKDIKNKEINTPMGMIDVLPTLGNMLGISSKYALGNDVMNIKDGDNTIVFNNGSYLTSKIYYNSRNGDIYPITNEVINNEYITKRVEYADEIINISNDIITYDLLKEIDN